MRILTLLLLWFSCLITWSWCDPPSSTPVAVNLTETRSDQHADVWKVETRSTGWTSWSEWSTCSRSCDGGVSHQLRRCTSQAGCKGEPVRYKICNMQPCPESREFRDSQCSSFDNVPYEGSLFHWTPHYDDSDPCSLTCRGRPRASTPENSIGNSIVTNSIGVEKDITNSLSADSTLAHINTERNTARDSEEEEEESTDAGGEEEDDDGGKLIHENQQMDDEALVVVARLAERVHDGTRCRPGSLDMCIDGKCRRVGCDLRIGSTKKVDACGVCGGDGTSCAQPLYHWTIAPMSLCSVTCGGGYKMSRPVCQNRVSGAEVEQQLCNAVQKPDATVVKCNTHKCPPRWVTGEWGTCSVSCGGGSRLRQVQCVEEFNNTRNKVNEHNCRGHKPRYQEPCNQIDCPKWRTSPWSGCSVSCGEGVQVRGVECRDNRDLPSVLCEEYAKPTTTQPCSTGIACPAPPDEDDHLDELLPGLYHTQPLLQPYPPDPPPPPAHAERLIGEQVAPSVTTFIADEWSHCSVTCGKGIRTREVHCKIFLEISRTIAKLPDTHCPGPKPEERETCIMEPCTMQNVIIDTVRDGYMDGMYPDTYRSHSTYESSSNTRGSSSASQAKSYSWKEQGYTECSASCLGGLQEMIVNCVRDDTQRVTSPYMCPPETKPAPIVRTCNEHACPPRWNYSDFQPCTKSCGFGIQTREVNCIHEVSQGGGGNTVVIPNHMCPQPPPPDRQYCNVLDCPVKWHTSEWSKCSKSCGGGIKERKVECKQVMAQNHVVDRPESMCPSSKPQERRPCNTKSCVLESDKPEIVVSNSSFIQHDVKRKRITVKIGGSATVFYGTMIKIKCHVKRFNRTKIQWAKDHNYLAKSKKYKISKKGALRIQNLAYSDSGIYTCMAGKSTADLSLTVKPKPGEFPSSEEIERHNQNRMDRNRLGDTSEALGSRNDGYHRSFVIGDDHSHEQRPGEGPQPLPKAQTGRNRNSFRPTMPPILSHGEGGGKSGKNKDKGKTEKVDASTPQHSSTTSGTEHDQDGALPSQLPANAGSHKPPLTAEVPSSSASRIMPHFQQLLANLQQLWPFQTFSQSRGHRMVAFPPEMDLIAPELDPLHHIYGDTPKPQRSSKIFSVDETSSNPSTFSPSLGIPTFSDYAPQSEDVTEDDLNLEGDGFHGMGRAVILGKGTADALKFEWMITDWSKCSQTCGGNGFQMRAAHCMVRLHNTTQDVDATLCEDANLATPPTIRKCGVDECPRWTTTEWTPCEESRCFNWNTAMQRRNVTCQTVNNTNGDVIMGNLKQCNEKDRPPHKQECFNEKCKGTWKVGEWSECAAACEAHGVKYRILQCVWYGTKKPAGTACREQSRPAIMKTCKGPPCPKGWWNNCVDHSKFCPNVKAMNMCRIRRYEQQCCYTCRIKG